MPNYRPNRLAETLKEEISQLILMELKDPRIGFVTVTGIDVTNDLAHAKVSISVLASEDEGKASLEILNSAAGFIRNEIGKRVKLRHIPNITFIHDPSIQRGAHIAQLLRDVGVSEEK